MTSPHLVWTLDSGKLKVLEAGSREFFKIATNRSGNFSQLAHPDLTIIFYCHFRTREFFKIATNRSGNFSQLSPPDLAIIFYRQVRGRGAPSETVQIFRIFPAKLPQTDPAIIFYCNLRIREFFKIATNRSGNFFKLSDPDAGIIFYWQVRSLD
jgi:hypothetical protein